MCFCYFLEIETTNGFFFIWSLSYLCYDEYFIYYFDLLKRFCYFNFNFIHGKKMKSFSERYLTFHEHLCIMPGFDRIRIFLETQFLPKKKHHLKRHFSLSEAFSTDLTFRADTIILEIRTVCFISFCSVQHLMHQILITLLYTNWHAVQLFKLCFTYTRLGANTTQMSIGVFTSHLKRQELPVKSASIIFVRNVFQLLWPIYRHMHANTSILFYLLYEKFWFVCLLGLL